MGNVTHSTLSIIHIWPWPVCLLTEGPYKYLALILSACTYADHCLLIAILLPVFRNYFYTYCRLKFVKTWQEGSDWNQDNLRHHPLEWFYCPAPRVSLTPWPLKPGHSLPASPSQSHSQWLSGRFPCQLTPEAGSGWANSLPLICMTHLPVVARWPPASPPTSDWFQRTRHTPQALLYYPRPYTTSPLPPPAWLPTKHATRAKGC